MRNYVVKNLVICNNFWVNHHDKPLLIDFINRRCWRYYLIFECWKKTIYTPYQLNVKSDTFKLGTG